MSEQFVEQLRLLPDFLGNHIDITIRALVAGIIIVMPLSIIATRITALRWPLLTIAGVIQTTPSLALLALFGLFLGLGFWPAFLALMLYSILPIMRNTITGILGIDPAMVEAARGLGMTPTQRLFKVELPLAMPVIIAGIRTSTVWVVGIATLSTPIGQTSLGNYIFGGLQTRNFVAVLFGCIAAAMLAIMLDVLIAGLEKSVAARKNAATVTLLIALTAIFGAGLSMPYIAEQMQTGDVDMVEDTSQLERTRTLPVIIGSKTFTEQFILAAVIENQLKRYGYRTIRKDNLGSTVAFDALRKNEIDVYVDYSGTVWANYMKRTDILSRDTMLVRTTAWLMNEYGILNLGPLGFENAYALAMRRSQAREMGIANIMDLAAHSDQMPIGSDYEFFNRPEWANLRRAYGLNFGEQVSLDSTFMYPAVADGEVDVITAFSSDGRIAAYDLMVLEDPKDAFPPYDAMLMISPVAADDPHLKWVLTQMLESIDLETMQQANLRVDRDEDPMTPQAAARWLEKQMGLADSEPQQ